MVDDLFFCTILTGRMGGHTPFVHARAESPVSLRRRLSRTHAVPRRVIPRVWVPMSGMKVQSLVVLSNHSAFNR